MLATRRLHNLKDVLLLNSLHNITSEPTRQLALLDPIILHENMSPLNQEIIRVPPDISDHCATYVYQPFEYPVHGSFTPNVWMYINANYELFNERLQILTGHVFIRVVLMKLAHHSQIFSLNLQNYPYLVKQL